VPLRLGISPFASTRDGARALAATAVSGGLDTIWMGDGLLANPDFPGWAGALEPFTELGWLAGATGCRRLGVSAAVLPVRDMAWLAKQALTLDVITDGGFVLAVAPGFWSDELAWRGVPFAARGTRFRDDLGMLRHLLGEAGRPGALAPAPSTPGGPPVWLAGGTATMQHALKLGLPFQASRLLPREVLPVAARWFAEGGTTLALRIRAQITTEAPAGHGVDWKAVAGPPSALVDAFGQYATAGVSDLSIVPGQDDDTSRRTVDALVTEVVPQLGDLVTTAHPREPA